MFALANTYYGERRRSLLHEKIAEELGVKPDDLDPILHYLEKKENISFPIEDIRDYHKMLEWDEKELNRWGYILYDFLKHKFLK